MTSLFLLRICGRLNGIKEVLDDLTFSSLSNLLSINQEVPVTEDEEASAVNLPLKAGFASLHEGCLIHGSLPNRSTRRRCGLTLRYVPTEVKQSTTNSQGKRWHPTLVRGIDRYRHWTEE